MGEKAHEALKLQFDRRLRLEFDWARGTSDAGLLARRELDGAMGLTEVVSSYLRKTRGGCIWCLANWPRLQASAGKRGHGVVLAG